MISAASTRACLSTSRLACSPTLAMRVRLSAFILLGNSAKGSGQGRVSIGVIIGDCCTGWQQIDTEPHALPQHCHSRRLLTLAVSSPRPSATSTCDVRAVVVASKPQQPADTPADLCAEFNATVTQKLISMRRCSNVAYKELFVPAEDLQGARGSDVSSWQAAFDAGARAGHLQTRPAMMLGQAVNDFESQGSAETPRWT